MNGLPLDVHALAALLVFVAAVATGLVVRRRVLGRLARLAAESRSPLDDAFVGSLERPLPFWFALAGAYAAAQLLVHGEGSRPLLRGLGVSLLVVSLALWAAELGVRLVAVSLRKRAGDSAAVTSALQSVVRISVWAVGAMVLLGSLGISVAPVLTTVGIGGIAVALGLQDTLLNLFAGVYVSLAGNLRVGDFVRLESGEEGYVDDIRWRATSVRTLPNNLVVVPNSRLAQSIVTNYHLPAQDLAVLVEVGVHYASDLAQVERVTCEVAREVLKTVPGGVPDFEPFIRYHDFGASSIDFTVILRAREFVDTYLIKHEFIKALARRFAAERIVVPFPIRAINLDQERSAPRSAGPGAG